jgi:ribosome-binding protein aMBF1 (putative translation factor)
MSADDDDHHDDRPTAGRRSVFPGFAALADTQEELVAELVARRRALGLSQTEVAARMGTSQSAVARLEGGGADARLSTVQRYAQALGHRLAWRLHDQPREEPDADTT